MSIPDIKLGAERGTQQFTVNWPSSKEAVGRFTQLSLENNAEIPISTRAYGAFLGGFLYDLGHFGRWRQEMPHDQGLDLPILWKKETSTDTTVVTPMSEFYRQLLKIVKNEVEIYRESHESETMAWQPEIDALTMLIEKSDMATVELGLRKVTGNRFEIKSLSSPEQGI